jgi:hypothetical protein
MISGRMWRGLAVLGLVLPAWAWSYPLDGYEETGIRRVEGSRRGHEGLAPGGFQPPGSQLSTGQVDLRLLNHAQLELPPPDPGFTAEIAALLGEHAGSYGVAVLDLTDPESPMYAEHRGEYRQNVGSVGKVIAALGLFQGLADTWPGDDEKRKLLLRDTLVTADEFSRTDHHTIRIFDVENNVLTRRSMQEGDRGSLWEYLDWTLSASSNSAAAMLMRDAMLLRRFGTDYPVSEQRIRSLFRESPAAELTELFQATFWEPLTRNGFDLTDIRQGSFFTARGKQKVNGGGGSYATPRSLAQLMLRMEQGRLVDEWSSRQLKRLLYVTETRIRYALSPELRKAAVYFKSGSFYRCRAERGFTCGDYRGNAANYMNSVAIIEHEVDGVMLHYIAVVVSNVLRLNAAREHQQLGGAVHRLIRQRHGVD